MTNIIDEIKSDIFFNSTKWKEIKDDIIGCPGIIRQKLAHHLFDNFYSKNSLKINQELFLHLTNVVVNKLLAPEIVDIQFINNLSQFGINIDDTILTHRLYHEHISVIPENFNFPDCFKTPQNFVGKLKIRQIKENVSITKKIIPDLENFYQNIDELAQKIADFIDYRIFDTIDRLSTNIIYEYDVNSYEIELVSKINYICNTIAQCSRKQAGNFAIVNGVALTILQSARTAAFAKISDKHKRHSSHVGILNNSVNVYFNDYVKDIIVGYHASKNDTPGSGIVYVPELLDFEDNSIIIKDDIFELPTRSDCMGNASDYYGKIKFKNLEKILA